MRRKGLKFLLRSALAAGLFWGGAALAEPWTPMNDMGLRDDIETLADFGVLRGPVTTWPIPWAQLAPDLNSADEGALPRHVAEALNRVRRFMPTEKDFGRTRYGGEIAMTNKQSFLRDFGAGARDHFDASAIVEHQWSNTFVRLQGGRQFDLHHGQWKLDGSYIAQRWGNWIWFAGMFDQWYGPGWVTSLILSNSARPYPKIGFMRNAPEPIDFPVLRWLGPWQFTGSFGVLNGPRTDYSDPYFLNMRLNFNPVRGMSVGVTATGLVCGKGRQCSFNTFKSVFFGSSYNNSGDKTRDPGDLTETLDFRYGGHIGKVTASLYGQILFEDSDRKSIAKNTARMVGASMTAPLAKPGWSMRFVGEYADTYGVANILDGQRLNDDIYEHYIYTYGYRYRGNALGASQDNDSRVVSGMFGLSTAGGAKYWLKFHHALLNMDNKVIDINTASLTRETINMMEASIQVPSEVGSATFTFRFQDDQPNTPNERHPVAAVEARWGFLF